MRRQRDKLTALAVRNAKKDTGDGQGLWLQVSSKFGTKSWLFQFTDPIFKKADSMGFGAVDRVSLAKARELAQKAQRCSPRATTRNSKETPSGLLNASQPPSK